jgi:hypothetical protein
VAGLLNGKAANILTDFALPDSRSALREFPAHPLHRRFVGRCHRRHSVIGKESVVTPSGVAGEPGIVDGGALILVQGTAREIQAQVGNSLLPLTEPSV